MLTRAILALACTLFPLAVCAQSIELGLPLSCTPGKDCWIQQYFDHASGPAVKDYACGLETYDGHDGTDIRVRDTTAAVDVVASAPGTVLGTRNDMDDHLLRTEADRAAVKDRECGNGVLVDNGNGWQTQYCHLRKGSVAVAKGAKVNRGDRLGIVGYSGMAAFPHLHIGIRRNGAEVDPFNPEGAAACGAAKPLWQAATLEALAYHGGSIIGLGFAPGPVALNDVEEGKLVGQQPSPDWAAIVAYGWSINLSDGDTLAITFAGPNGVLASTEKRVVGQKAQYFLFAGKKSPPGGWPEGTYRATVRISSGETLKAEKKQEFELR